MVGANSSTGQATFDNNITGGNNAAKVVEHTHTFPTTSLKHFHRPTSANYSFAVVSEGSDLAVGLQENAKYQVSHIGAVVGKDSSNLLGATVYIRANQLSSKTTNRYSGNTNTS